MEILAECTTGGHTVRSRYSPVFAALSLLCLGTAAVHANQITYNFSGTLSSALNGSTAVTGQFTLDFTTISIAAFSFTTPFDVVDPTNYVAELSVLTPAVSPNTDFVQLYFADDAVPPPGDVLILLFQTSFAFFDGSTLYTGPVEIFPGGANISELDCSQSGGACGVLGVGGASEFASGSAQPATTTPEPGSIVLLAIGALLCVFRSVRSRLSQTER
jgi:hypothetical protein